MGVTSYFITVVGGGASEGMGVICIYGSGVTSSPQKLHQRAWHDNMAGQEAGIYGVFIGINEKFCMSLL